MQGAGISGRVAAPPNFEINSQTDHTVVFSFGGGEGVIPGEAGPQAEITAPPRGRKREFTMGSTQEMEEP